MKWNLIRNQQITSIEPIEAQRKSIDFTSLSNLSLSVLLHIQKPIDIQSILYICTCLPCFPFVLTVELTHFKMYIFSIPAADVRHPLFAHPRFRSESRYLSVGLLELSYSRSMHKRKTEPESNVLVAYICMWCEYVFDWVEWPHRFQLHLNGTLLNVGYILKRRLTFQAFLGFPFWQKRTDNAV